MIGPWDETGCVLKMASAAWPPPGNGIADKYIGNHPIYPLATRAMSFNFFTSAFGFKTATGKTLTDGVDDYMEVASGQTLYNYNAPFSIETIIRVQITPAGAEIFCILNESAAGAPLRLWYGDVGGYLGFNMNTFTGNKFGYGNRATFHNIKMHLALTYNGNGDGAIGNWTLYLAGSPVALSPYAGATGGTGGKHYFFAGNPLGFYCKAEVWDITIYNVELSAARVAVNAGLGDNYGLIGNNVGDLMNLSAAGVKAFVPAGIFEGSH